jgi:galactokinase
LQRLRADANSAARPRSEIHLSATKEIGARTFAAPARVNLIGEHTDYTGGFVMPFAIPFHTEATITLTSDGAYSFASETFSEVRRMTPPDRSGKIDDWSDYPVGVLRQLQALGVVPPPFQIAFRSDVPLASGLSSSAAIEVATAMALLAHSEVSLAGEEIAMLCQRAENQYVDSPCGIMDQFVVTNAKAEHALLLNTRDLSFSLLPMNQGALSGCVVVVANSCVKHSVAGGDYGLRRRELEAGQNVLRDQFPHLRDLGDATLDQLAACENEMSAESYRRCRHVISENARVLQARDAMLAGDPVALGRVMTQAHASERDDFEVSVEEIDFLVDTAIAWPGCFGARLTGGGFGGCTVNLVEANAAEAFSRRLKSAFRGRFRLDAETYVCSAVDGAIALAAKNDLHEDAA